MSSVSEGTLRVAVLMTSEVQLLDMSGIDLFGMLDKEYTRYLPGPLSKLGFDVQIYYIGNDGTQPSGRENDKLRGLTAQVFMKAEHSVNSPEVQPGQLDILLIPGPPPDLKPSEGTLKFVRKHASAGTTILTVCTGCYVAAYAGILDGRTASGPRGLVSQLRKDFSAVTWNDQKRYVKDTSTVQQVSEGELWTSGGVTNGLEMIAAFLKEKYPGPLSETVCAMADVGEKGEGYTASVGVDTAWWIGQIFRAAVFGQRSPASTKTSH